MELTIQDVQNMILIIDTMAARGAVKGEELASVGQFRAKLSQVVTDAVSEETEERDEPEAE